ncbi:DOMON-like domain-containing protein [Sphingosinicella sp. YJ22]|uniref:DOMON-like domain-containing protein n=1 Tax=Sphingosinicella sp. YJ22 TaxID=1104780 RepID=UPI00140C22E5|nr:DOMON-like domain-containing protein [Sphingosinicella sp. YJ22]
MQVLLTPHPGSLPARNFRLEAGIDRYADALRLEFAWRGDTSELLIPGPCPPRRRDELWRSTCFEAFVSVAGNDAYYEINISPSGEWASYRFSRYREGMAPASLAPFEDPFVLLDEAILEVSAVIEFNGASELGQEIPLLLNLTAVIEERDGTKSYWALNHPPEGPPDFHHAACFTLELPPAPAP